MIVAPTLQSTVFDRMSAPRWLGYSLAQPRDLPNQLATGFALTAESSKHQPMQSQTPLDTPTAVAPGRRRTSSEPIGGKWLYDRTESGRSGMAATPQSLLVPVGGTLTWRSPTVVRLFPLLLHGCISAAPDTQAVGKITAHAAPTNSKIVAALAEILPLRRRSPARPAGGRRSGSPMAPICTTAPFGSDSAYRHGSIVPAASKGAGCVSILMAARRAGPASRPGRGSLGCSLPDHETRRGAPGRDRRSAGSRVPPCRDRGRRS